METRTVLYLLTRFAGLVTLLTTVMAVIGGFYLLGVCAWEGYEITFGLSAAAP